MNTDMVATVAVIAADPARSRRLFVETIGLPLEGEAGTYLSSGEIRGCNHFGVWPLSQASEACFGTPDWPADRLVPQASIEFEVESPDAVEAAAAELVRAGHDLLHPTRTEPWGQTVARLQSEDGLIIGMSYIPAFHSDQA